MKKIEGEMFIRHLLTTLLEMLFQFMVDTEVIFKTVRGPDDNCHGKLHQALILGHQAQCRLEHLMQWHQSKQPEQTGISFLGFSFTQ